MIIIIIIIIIIITIIIIIHCRKKIKTELTFYFSDINLV